MKKATKVLAIAALAAVVSLAGCSPRVHSRTIVREYDASGRLMGTTTTDFVRQADPSSKPLMDVLKNETYRK